MYNEVAFWYQKVGRGVKLVMNNVTCTLIEEVQRNRSFVFGQCGSLVLRPVRIVLRHFCQVSWRWYIARPRICPDQLSSIPGELASTSRPVRLLVEVQ